MSRQVAAAAAALEANKEFQNMIREGSGTQVQERTPNNVAGRQKLLGQEWMAEVEQKIRGWKRGADTPST